MSKKEYVLFNSRVDRLRAEFLSAAVAFVEKEGLAGTGEEIPLVMTAVSSFCALVLTTVSAGHGMPAIERSAELVRKGIVGVSEEILKHQKATAN